MQLLIKIILWPAITNTNWDKFNSALLFRHFMRYIYDKVSLLIITWNPDIILSNKLFASLFLTLLNFVKQKKTAKFSALLVFLLIRSFDCQTYPNCWLPPQHHLEYVARKSMIVSCHLSSCLLFNCRASFESTKPHNRICLTWN